MSMSFNFVVVIAGRGERAGSPEDGPKQYRLIGGKPVVEHTLATILNWPSTKHINLVIHRDDEALIKPVLQALGSPHNVTLVHGGASRQQSVLAGLEAFDGDGTAYVMIHDGVRPFIEHDLLERIAAAHQNHAEGVLPALAVTDTLKSSKDSVVITTVPRAGLYYAQTPQSFTFAAILEAHRKAAAITHIEFTDDASIAEWAGIPVTLIDGSVDNVKLTLKRDITMADEKLSAHIPDIRTGNGYDVHQLEAGDGVTLCGIFIPHNQRLKGHSDADVALHALTDALLATCGAGDIGDHFPPSEPQWKGAASKIFLEHALRVVKENGGTVLNADVSLIAEEPKIGPHRLAMRQFLANTLEISLDRCSVKATTNETIGFVGRREGIAAIATASVFYQGK
jgi:2-C-methyl-D-erythritol 4-phosphate cytidylyltransferase/2-C-methyl-D-erythritol 2,4-cyclodiphosphate synthase